MATKKKPNVKVHLTCTKTAIPNEVLVALTHAESPDNLAVSSFKCPYCSLRLYPSVNDMSFKAHGKNDETIGHKLLKVEGIE